MRNFESEMQECRRKFESEKQNWKRIFDNEKQKWEGEKSTFIAQYNSDTKSLKEKEAVLN